MKTILIALLSVVSLNAFADIPLTINCNSRGVTLNSNVILMGGDLALGTISELMIIDNYGTKRGAEDLNYRLDVSYSTVLNMSLIKMNYEFGKTASVSLTIPDKAETFVDDKNPTKMFISNIMVQKRDSTVINELATCTVKYD